MIELLKRKKSVFLLILGLLLIASQAGYAQDATLTNITVSNTQYDLLLFLNLQGAFREEMKQAILSGAPSTFSFFAKLNRVRSLWFDKDIADLEVTHTIVYDNLKKEFTVTRSWKDNNPEMTKSFDEAQKWMTEIDSLKIIPLSRLEKGEQYQLRVKAEVSKKTLPLYLHYILFFVSLWDFETDWYTIDFTF